MFAMFLVCVMMVGMVAWFGFGEQKVMEYLRRKDEAAAMHAEIIELPVRENRVRKVG